MFSSGRIDLTHLRRGRLACRCLRVGGEQAFELRQFLALPALIPISYEMTDEFPRAAKAPGTHLFLNYSLEIFGQCDVHAPHNAISCRPCQPTRAILGSLGEAKIVFMEQRGRLQRLARCDKIKTYAVMGDPSTNSCLFIAALLLLFRE